MLVLRGLRSAAAHHWASRNHLTRASMLAALAFLMSFAAFLESVLWAGFYVWIEALPGFDDALYFSLVTFTTLGYGDVTLNEQWRMLGAFQAANGILMFGWTTAPLVAVSHRVIAQRGSAAEDG
jgi:hypothetical protein